MTIPLILMLAAAILALATLYSSVGHAGASGYLGRHGAGHSDAAGGNEGGRVDVEHLRRSHRHMAVRPRRIL